MEACMSDIPDCKWLAQWQELVKHFAFQFNPTFTSKTNIALSMLQLGENQLYASDLTLIERNLHTLHHILNLFENTDTHQQQTLERIMMDAREP
ncbi:unnamed protein product [Rotaria sordida]|uniref:Uncharacterized protein n=1 Tax=Rotaria sordida TaxID=392033 RepID=A0A819E622_9BILA|nr:unnamed protein product [Rotaria sordida]